MLTVWFSGPGTRQGIKMSHLNDFDCSGVFVSSFQFWDNEKTRMSSEMGMSLHRVLAPEASKHSCIVKKGIVAILLFSENFCIVSLIASVALISGAD